MNPDQNQTYIDIYTSLAKQGTILDSMNQDLKEIRDDVREIKRDYMPRSEAKLQFESLNQIILAIQIQVKSLLEWQLAETKRAGDDKNEHDTKLNTKIISWQGGILVTIISFIIWLLQQYLTSHH